MLPIRSVLGVENSQPRAASDPAACPLLLSWRHRYSGVLREVVRLASPYPGYDWLEMGWIEVMRGNLSKVNLRSPPFLSRGGMALARDAPKRIRRNQPVPGCLGVDP